MPNQNISSFEDLVAFQKARLLTKKIYATTRVAAFSKDLALAGQMRRAVVSIMSNIAEGHERTGPAEYAHFVSTAKGSCAELRAQLYVALDAGYISEDLFEELREMALEVGRLLGGLLTALQRRKSGGR